MKLNEGAGALDIPDIKAIIFDCFGVLTVDTQQLYYERFTKDQAIAFHDMNQMRDHGFLSQEEYLSAVSKLADEPLTTVRQRFLKDFHLNEELISLIRRQLKPRYKIGLLSNIGRDWIDDIVGKKLLEELFDAVVLSGEEGITKPNPLIYERMAERLEVVPQECVMIDDTQRNCDGAKAVGMSAILYRNMADLKTEFSKLAG